MKIRITFNWLTAVVVIVAFTSQASGQQISFQNVPLDDAIKVLVVTDLIGVIFFPELGS